MFQREYKYGCHNYKPVPVALTKGKGEEDARRFDDSGIYYKNRVTEMTIWMDDWMLQRFSKFEFSSRLWTMRSVIPTISFRGVFMFSEIFELFLCLLVSVCLQFILQHKYGFFLNMDVVHLISKRDQKVVVVGDTPAQILPEFVMVV